MKSFYRVVIISRSKKEKKGCQFSRRSICTFLQEISLNQWYHKSEMLIVI